LWGCGGGGGGGGRAGDEAERRCRLLSMESGSGRAWSVRARTRVVGTERSASSVKGRRIVLSPCSS